MDQRIKKVVALMQSNLCHDLSLDSLSRSVNLSSSRLRHLFKNEMGITPPQHLHALRMERAKQLLETTFLRIKEIAPLVGASCDSCFVREFKRTYGLSPARYRAQHQSTIFDESRSESRVGQNCQ